MTTIQDRIIKDFRDKWTKAPDYHDPNTHQNYPAKYIERMSSLGFFVNMDEVEQFIIQSIKEVEEETRKEKDIAEKFLYTNLPLDLSIGTEFEVGGRYEDWGFIVMYKGNKISEGGTLEEAINNAKSKLSITNKEKQ